MNASRIAGSLFIFALALASAPVVGAPNPPGPTPSPTVMPPGAALVRRFETHDAVRALDAVNYKPCRQPGEAGGEAVVEITYQQSGDVASSRVMPGSELSVATGACIAKVLRRATIDGYVGKQQTVLYVVRLP